MRRNQSVTIAALIIAIVGLSIGFAAFSNTLTIRSSATVNPENTMSVVFSTNSERLVDTDPVVPNSAAYGENATIKNTVGNPTLKGLKAKFTEPGQSVTYSLYLLNNGNYDAYLTNLDFSIADTTNNKFYLCTPATGTTVSLMNSACEAIYVTVTIGLDTFTSNAQTGLQNEISNHLLEVGDSEAVTVTITYPSTAPYVDGNFTIDFGDINVQYRTLDTPTTIVIPEIDYSDMFVSYEQGVLSRYIGTDTDVEIPDGLMLPVTTETFTYNETKCIEFGKLIMETDDSAASKNFCDEEVKTMFPDLGEGQLGTLSSSDLSGDILEMAPSFSDVSISLSQQKYLITSIGDSAFFQKGLTSVSIGNGITTIGENAFDDNNIVSLDLSGATSLITIGEQAFSENDIVELIIPSGVVTIGLNSFVNNDITSVTIPGSVTTIGDSAFSGNSLTSVVIPGSVTTIGDGAFNGNNLTSVTIPSSVTIIGDSAFNGNNLTSVDLSSATSLTTIGNNAFSQNALTNVIIPGSVTTIGSSAFNGNNLTTVTMYPTKQVLESQINAFTFGYSANCFDDPEHPNYVTNSCITWVNG